MKIISCLNFSIHDTARIETKIVQLEKNLFVKRYSIYTKYDELLKFEIFADNKSSLEEIKF